MRSPTIASDAGMAVCGAGCMGFVNNALGVRALGYLEPDPLAASGSVSLVTHSGSAFSTLLRARRGFGFRLAVSSGQELVTDTADYVELCARRSRNPNHRAAAGDTPCRVRVCATVLLRAAEQDVPWSSCTVGGSPRGRAMVAAHSGALAGEHAAWQAFCAATGAMRGHRSGRVHRHHRAVLRRAACQARTASRPCMIRVPNAHCAPTSPTISASSSPHLSPPRWRPSASMLDDGLAPTNPLDVWGTGADTRNLFGELPAGDGRRPRCRRDRAGRRPGHRVRRRHRLRRRRHSTSPSTPMRRWRCWHRWPRRSIAPTADRLRDSGIPVLEGARSGLAALAPPGSLAAAASTGRRRGASPNGSTDGGRLSQPARRRRSSCWPTTASRWSQVANRGLRRRRHWPPPLPSAIPSH